jgi:cobyrinic acid a,c-diamide synthase
MCAIPRLMIAGLSGGSGKTIVSAGLLLLLRRAGIAVRAFKKGPDYIDPAWLAWASGHPARNLDTYFMGTDGVRSSFLRAGVPDGINVIEGNRGLFDGFDAEGTHSSAVLAEALAAPVLLVVDATKMTRTAAALVLGCQKLDEGGALRGVVLNNVNGRRHEQILRAAIASACAIPVVGALPRAVVNPLPERHLGLVPPQEQEGLNEVEQNLVKIVDGCLDIDAVLAIARSAPPLERRGEASPRAQNGQGIRIGYVKDAAFSFYYPENLEELERAGAEMVAASALQDRELPANLHALYIGGGFPETHAWQLAGNRSFLKSLRQASQRGMPIYAECGGVMLLARSFFWKGVRHPMAGVFPIDVEVLAKPQGHGYTELRVDASNPLFQQGIVLRGHEFHYSRMVAPRDGIETACAVERGTGCGGGRDFLVTRKTMAGYTHLHAAGCPEWAWGLVEAARTFMQTGACSETVKTLLHD